MHTDECIFLAIEIPFKMLAYIDMYIDYGGGFIHSIHSSSQIGERLLYDTTWTDQTPAFHFGNSNAWYANEMRFDRIKAQELIKENKDRDRNLMQLDTTFPYDGFEFIFRKSRFQKMKWKVRIEVKTGMPGYHNVFFPENSHPKKSETWSVLLFSDQ